MVPKIWTIPRGRPQNPLRAAPRRSKSGAPQAGHQAKILNSADLYLCASRVHTCQKLRIKMEEAAAALASVLPTSEAHLHSLLCSQDKFFAAVRCRLIGLLPAEVASAEMASPEPAAALDTAARAAAITALVSLVHAHRILAQTDGGATALPATSGAALLAELPPDERSALLSCAAALGLSSPGSHETVGSVLAHLRSAADTLSDDGCSAADTAESTHSGALLSRGRRRRGCEGRLFTGRSVNRWRTPLSGRVRPRGNGGARRLERRSA